MAEPVPTYAISDIHGYVDRLRWHLGRAGLMDDGGDWCGGTARLWLQGDYVDRGPDGIGVIELIMRLQREAADAGGEALPVLGNHEALILAADRFGEARTRWGRTFRQVWEMNGGQQSDLERLTERHRQWIAALPVMALREPWLLVHADATFYHEYGDTRAAVNQSVCTMLAGADAEAWATFLTVTAGRRAFIAEDAESGERLDTLLAAYGGTRLIHGHTPISAVRAVRPAEVAEALVYAGGRCVNVDGGIPYGGPGILYRVPEESSA